MTIQKQLGIACCLWAMWNLAAANEPNETSATDEGYLSADILAPFFRLFTAEIIASGNSPTRPHHPAFRHSTQQYQPLVVAARQKKSRLIGSRLDWEEDDESQYAIFRTRGEVYIKGKAGYVWEDEEEDPNILSISEIVDNLDVNGAFGLGAGYKLGNGDRLEFEYVVNKRDLKVFSVGYSF
jgi:hypothetical protein